MDLRDLHRAAAGRDATTICWPSPRRAEQLGFDAFFRSDHFLTMGGDGLPGPTDAWVTLGRDGPRDRAHPAGHAGHVGDLPAARPARHRGGPGRRDERRPGRAGHRRRLVRGRARRLRDPVPRDRRALRPVRGAAGGRHRPVGHTRRRALRVRRAALPGRRLPRPAQARPVTAAAGHHRRQRAEAHAARWRPATPTSSTCRSTPSTPPGRWSAGSGRRARTPAATPTSWCTPTPWCSASGRTRPSSPAARPPSGARWASSRENGLAGTPQEVVDRIGEYAATGSTRIYLQVLDLADLEHLDLVAAEVMPHV